MSEKRTPSESQVAKPETAPSDGESSEVESWLRMAARSPHGEARTVLPQPGQVIGGKYRIEEQLGKGGMGAVYRATHVVSDKQVALKWMLRPATDERALQRFTREARAAGRVDHPNVVDVYDIGQEGDAGYLVMALLRGESLRQRLARGPLAPTDAVDLLLPAMRGVAAAHREGVIHRDLKPDNVFLCRGPEGDEREAKVLDFGISSVSTPEREAKTTLTKEGTVLGTPSYMSPEQLESVRDADARTDVYAFGVILYEALTGNPPFASESYSALVLAIANARPRPPHELRPEIPVALSRVVMHAIEKDRDQRVQTMAALIAALSPFASVQGAGSGEHASMELERATQPGAKRGRGKLAVTAALALAALAGYALWVLRTHAPSAVVSGSARSTLDVAGNPKNAAPPRFEQTAAAPAVPAAPPAAMPLPAEPPRLEAEAPPAARRKERATRPPSGPLAPAGANGTPDAQSAPGPLHSAPARSGSIKLDEL